MNFETWLTATIGTGGVLAFIIFLSKNTILNWLANSIKHKYAKDLETHKANLKRDYDVQIANLNAQSQIANVRFSHIFVKQAESIATTYEKMLPLLEATRTYVRVLPSPDTKAIQEKFKILDEFRTDFEIYFQLVRIYIPPATASLVDKFFVRLYRLANLKNILADNQKLPGKSEQRGEKIQWLSNESDEVESEVNQLMGALIENFQSVLGVHKEEKK